MKKRFLVVAVAATLISPLAAQAEVTLYGNVHLSIDSLDDNDATTALGDSLDFNSNTSAIGVKGKEDLGGGMSAIFKVEFQVAPDERNGTSSDITKLDDDDLPTPKDSTAALTDRDQWVGLKGAMGTVKFGTMSSNYKQMGGKVDPLYRTAAEGRASGMQSNLHSGAGNTRGRSTNTLQYTSPAMSGVSVVFNTTFSNADGNADETTGLGIRYKAKNILAYFDYIDMDSDGGAGTQTESAIKVGGSYKMGALKLSLQHELTADLLGEDTTFFAASYGLNDNDTVAFTFASAAADVSGAAGNNDGSGYALAYDHKMSKRTNVYLAYLSADMDDDNNDLEGVSLGLRHKF